MLNRDTRYYKSLERDRKGAMYLERSRELEKLSAVNRNAALWLIFYIVGYTLFFLVTLCFNTTSLLIGGYYSAPRGFAIAIFLVYYVLLGGGLALTVLIPKLKSMAGIHFIRWLQCLFTVFLSVSVMCTVGLMSYIWIAIAAVVVSVAFELMVHSRSWDGFGDGLQWFVIVSAVVATALSLLVMFVPLNGSSDRYFSATSFSRTVQYEREDDGASLNIVMLNAFDAFGISDGETFEVASSVNFWGEECAVVTVGEGAFRNVRSVDTVILPETVLSVKRGAFEASSVKKVITSSTAISIYDIFSNSSVNEIVLTSGTVADIFIDAVSEGLVISVPRELVYEYAERYPQLKAHIAPILNEGEVYATVCIDGVEGDNTIVDYYEYYIFDRENGGAVSIPYADYFTTNEDYGDHWAMETEWDLYRLVSLEHCGEEITCAPSIQITENSRIYGRWQRMHFVYADLSAVGGDYVLLEELNVKENEYILPTDYRHASMDGYFVNSWYPDEATLAEPVASIKDFTMDYTLYPGIELLPPELSADNYSATYDGAEHTLNVAFSHPASVELQSIRWKKDGYDYILAGGVSYPTVKQVSDSGIYTAIVTVTDSDGRTSTAEIDIEVSISPATVTVIAEPKESVWGEEMESLTYSYSSSVAGAHLRGELNCNIDGAGVYEIEIGTLEAGANFVISYQGASYTVKKAQTIIDVSGIKLNYVYTGKLQTVEGAVINHGETFVIYSHNTFTTVAEGNGLTVTVMVAESANYLGAVETVEISVAPMKVTLPEYQTSLAYTAETVELLESGEYYSVEGGSAVERGDYVATVILKDPENCVWEDADFMGTIEWKII